MRFDVVLTDEANRALEALPGPVRDDVLAALERNLPRLEKRATPGRVDDISYLRATIAPGIDVVFRRAAGPGAETVYVVLVLERA